MIRVLGVCGSPRNASTQYSLEQALQAAAEVEGVETELVTLRGKKVNPCISCNKCVKEKSRYCTIYDDDMQPLYDSFYNADAYLMASPVYQMNFSAQLAAYFNRFRPSYTVLKEDPDYFSRKIGGAIAVGGTRNGGQECTINNILGFYHTMGVLVVNSGMGGYSGACVWSRDRMAQGAAEDEAGMKYCAHLGKKVAEVGVKLGGSSSPK